MESTLLCAFLLPLSLIMPSSIQFGFSLGIQLFERRFGYFLWIIFRIQSYSKYKNHFDVSFKQTCSEKIQAIFIDRLL
jgi:hypothetical protein